MVRKRRAPGLYYPAKMRILEGQGNRCIYCGISFGGVAIEWDHVEPYSCVGYSGESNMVAACKVCNGIKSNIMFDSVVEARRYILRVRKVKGRATHMYDDTDYGVLSVPSMM